METQPNYCKLTPAELIALHDAAERDKRNKFQRRLGWVQGVLWIVATVLYAAYIFKVSGGLVCK
jgi:hypothetical protein